MWNCSLGRTSVTVTLPIAFKNMCTVALATPTGAPWDGVGTYAITHRTTSQITIYGDYSQTSINSDALVIALGF
ncbi:gp53-like domain-containing protein [Phascolarctobacterium faecium]|uniref:gp53-like domain-containing protein n=1 Tax=Phascolarctobacterium faecium TaxID=33025 RepID=UPI003AB42162